MTRLASAFQAARGRTGLIPYLTAGYPSLEASLELMQGFAAASVLAIEVGIPFSDPIADGPEIQRASEHAVRSGVGVAQVLELVRAFRSRVETPVVIMTYANPVVHHGAQRFAAEASAAGTDGVLISDLPPEEAPELWGAMDAAGLDTVTLVAPTTPSERLPSLIGRARGFVYLLARTGVTGRGGGDASGFDQRLSEVRALTRLPVAIGFGIANPAQAAALAGTVDAVVVGAALMRALADGPPQGAVSRAAALAQDLSAALRRP